MTSMLVLGAMALIGVALLAQSAFGQSEPIATISVAPTPLTYSQAKDLTGQELVDAMGLKPIVLQAPEGEETAPIPWGTGPLAECPPPPAHASLMTRGDSLFGSVAYCVTVGEDGTVATDFQAWDLSYRFGSDSLPSQGEIDAWHLDQRAMQARENGDMAEGQRLGDESLEVRT